MADARVLPQNQFGRSIVIDMPAGCDMIVVFADHHQHRPVWIGLPHQLYLGTARDLMREHGADSLTIVPYRNADKVTISRRFVANAIHSAAETCRIVTADQSPPAPLGSEERGNRATTTNVSNGGQQ